MKAIKKGIAINQKYVDAQTYAKKLEGIARATYWYQSKAKFQKANKVLQQQKIMEDQLSQGRKELFIKRNFRLKQLYNSESQNYEKQLQELGLAIHKTKN